MLRPRSLHDALGFLLVSVVVEAGAVELGPQVDLLPDPPRQMHAEAAQLAQLASFEAVKWLSAVSTAPDLVLGEVEKAKATDQARPRSPAPARAADPCRPVGFDEVVGGVRVRQRYHCIGDEMLHSQVLVHEHLEPAELQYSSPSPRTRDYHFVHAVPQRPEVDLLELLLDPGQALSTVLREV